MALLVESLSTLGTGRSIVIDADNTIIAGNGVVEAAALVGIERVRVIESSGKEIIAVRRSDLTPEQRTRLALLDNRTAELAEWNPDVLAALRSGGALDGLWSEKELTQIHRAASVAGKADADAAPPVRKTKIKRGDLFVLGEHRLLCGDSTDAGDVARLLSGVVPEMMVTDPPYGVNYDPMWRVRAGVTATGRGGVQNDDRADWRAAWALFPGAVAYVWHGGLHAHTVAESLTSCGFALRAQIVWVKSRAVLSRGHYHWQHEPAFYASKAADAVPVYEAEAAAYYAVRQGESADWTGSRRESTVWFIDHRVNDSGHGTQKPVECMRRPLQNHRPDGSRGAVYDPFCGSGTTLIACEQEMRPGYAMELDPAYAQVIVDRWEAFAGLKARKG